MSLVIAAPQPRLIQWAGRSLIKNVALVIAGSALLALSAQVEVPMVPVPMTLQTLAVLLIGAFCGARLGFATAALYLLEGAAGLPVFAGGAAGLPILFGPTAGYLVAFPFATLLVGFAADKGWLKNIVIAFAVMLGAHAVIFASGVGYLATFIGFNAAIVSGFMHFVLGTLVKSALATAAAQLEIKRG